MDNHKFSFGENGAARAILGAASVCLSVLCVIVLYWLSGMKYSDVSGKTLLNTGWIVEYDGNTYADINLEDFRTSHPMNAGDAITLYNTLPQYWGYDVPVVRIQAHNSMVSVFVGGQSRYRYGQELYVRHKNLGSGYHYALLEDADKGKQIRIVLRATEFASFSSIDDIILTDYRNSYKQLMVEYRGPYMIGNFLVIFGIFLIGVTGFLMYRRWELSRLCWVGLLSLCIGGWTVCNYRQAEMYGIPFGYSSFLEHLSLYVGIISLMMYFRGYVCELGNKVMLRLFKAIVGTEVIYTAAMITLHMLGILHLPSGLPVIHIYMIISMGYLLAFMVMYLRMGKPVSKIICAGFVVLVIFLILEAVSYALKKYIGSQSLDSIGFAAIGAIFLICFMLVSFGVEIADKLKVATEKEVLYRMAYTDDLTQVHNRRYCEELLGRLVMSDKTYGVFSFDLNDLKKVNDSLGHRAGDALIAGFAHILNQAFDGVASVGRMGGDEFIVIVEDADNFDLEASEQRLKEALERANQKEKRFQFSAAYGYADSSETENVSVYTLADDRMYANKRKLKTPR